MDGDERTIRIPRGIRSESIRSPNASRAGALHLQLHSHLQACIHRHFVYARGGRRLMHADMTDRARKALAELVSELRASAHLPAWDVPGIAAAISRARSKAPADEVAIALLRLSTRADLRSPAVLAEDGPHWRDLEQHARTVRPSDAPRCPKPGHTSYPASNCGACRSEQIEDLNPRPVVLVDASQAAANTEGARRAMAALGRREGDETR